MIICMNEKAYRININRGHKEREQGTFGKNE